MTDVKKYFLDAFHHLGGKRDMPTVDVRFYRYAGLRHNIKLRSGHVCVRLSDICKDSPPEVMRALAFVLVARLLRKKIPPVHERTYRDYSLTPEVMRLSDIARRDRGWKMISSARGKYYDLEKMFSKLNRSYFSSSLEKPTLTWSQRRTRSILGHHDRVYDTIVISKSLDSAQVPEWCVEFIVYHEMLHMKHAARMINGRRYCHTAAFKLDERRFAKYDDAQRWLEQVARQRRVPRTRAA
ncbi:MAG TPA: SprT-like domain-containing protein [Pyrinomonadaceae bacterium]|jgi:hypothetical protein|nr:SprT-like domain-containing protein [Pyrinomonadaceae bacterium]